MKKVLLKICLLLFVASAATAQTLPIDSVAITGSTPFTPSNYRFKGTSVSNFSWQFLWNGKYIKPVTSYQFNRFLPARTKTYIDSLVAALSGGSADNGLYKATGNIFQFGVPLFSGGSVFTEPREVNIGIHNLIIGGDGGGGGVTLGKGDGGGSIQSSPANAIMTYFNPGDNTSNPLIKADQNGITIQSGTYDLSSVSTLTLPITGAAGYQNSGGYGIDYIAPDSTTFDDNTLVHKKWVQDRIAAATGGGVTSVNTRTGDVVLDKGDVNLPDVDNTSDADKPISTATEAALAAKQATLVSNVNIKRINGNTILGPGNITLLDSALNKPLINGKSDSTRLYGAVLPTYAKKDSALTKNTNLFGLANPSTARLNLGFPNITTNYALYSTGSNYTGSQAFQFDNSINRLYVNATGTGTTSGATGTVQIGDGTISKTFGSMFGLSSGFTTSAGNSFLTNGGLGLGTASSLPSNVLLNIFGGGIWVDRMYGINFSNTATTNRSSINSNVNNDIVLTTSTGGAINLSPAATQKEWINTQGHGFGTGLTNPQAQAHFSAGTTTAYSQPVKFTAGSLLTTPENGAFEYTSTHLYMTIGGVRYQLDQQVGGGFTNPMTSVGDIIVGGASGTPARLAIGGANTVLHGGTTPSYSAVALASDATGILPAANGGAGTANGILKANGSGLVSAAVAGTDYAVGTSYLGQVATHCLVPTNKYAPATGQWTMARSLHKSNGTIVNPVVVFPNFTVSSTDVETVNSGGTIKATIEYPIGTFTLSNENITGGGLIAYSGALIPLTFNLTIPDNAIFYVRTLQVNNNGPVYQNYQNGFNGPLTEGFESGTGTPSDKTQTGTVTYGQSFCYMPILILAQTNKPAAIIVGDSKQAGGRDAVTDQYGDLGEVPRAISPFMGYTNLSIAGSLLAPYLSATRTVRDQIINGTITGYNSGTPYFTHIISARGVNDLGGGGSAATLVTNRAAFAALYPNLTCIGTTLTPYNTSTDLWETTANQSPGTNVPKILAFNRSARFGITGEKNILDVGKAIDPYDIGLWPVSPNINNSIPYNQFTGTGSISGTTLTMAAVTGTIKLYDYITGPNLASGVVLQITAFGTGSGGTGTYTVNQSETAASGTIKTGSFGTYDGLHESPYGYVMVANYLKPFIPLIFRR